MLLGFVLDYWLGWGLTFISTYQHMNFARVYANVYANVFLLLLGGVM